MKTPTQHQLKFVQAIEDAVTDIVQRNISVNKIHQITDHAEYSMHDLTNHVNRLKGWEQWDLIERLAEAFLKVGMAPKPIVRALEARTNAIMTPSGSIELKGPYIDSEPLELKRSLPKELPTVRPQRVNPEVLPAEGKGDIVDDLAKVIRIIERWDMPNQRKLASQAYQWVGMGE